MLVATLSLGKAATTAIPLLEMTEMGAIDGEIPQDDYLQSQTTPPAPTDFQASFENTILSVSSSADIMAQLVVRNISTNAILINRYFTDEIVENIPTPGNYELIITCGDLRLVGNFEIPNNFTEEQEISRSSDPQGHSYAIILQGGTFEEQYDWNNCAEVYRTLKQHGYTDEDIYVLFSVDFGTQTDLDGDGDADIDMMTTSDNVTEFFDQTLPSILSANDNLFIYIVGGQDFTVGLAPQRDPIHLPATETCGTIIHLREYNISDCDLSEKILSLPISFVNVVFDNIQPLTFANGFRRSYEMLSQTITPPNWVLTWGDNHQLTSDGNYTAFTYYWTAAVNQIMLNGNAVNSDINSDGAVSMYEAFSNLSGHLVRYNGIESQPECLKNEMTIRGPELLDSYPCLIPADLYIQDNYLDRGIEPNVTTDEPWITPDVWFENMSYEPVGALDAGEDYYVCVQVRNRGQYASGNNAKLHVHWTKAVIGGSWPWSWYDEYLYDCNGTQVLRGSEITPPSGVSIPPILGGGSCVIKVPWRTPTGMDYTSCSEFVGVENELSHFCVLAHICDDDFCIE